jgi:transcriptional regulator with XRE-family HTH domain
MDNNILEIKKAIEKQGVTGRQAAIKAGLPVNTVSRILGGVTKKPDMEVIKKLQIALGLVAGIDPTYAGSSDRQQITQEENELLRYFRQLCPDQKNSAMMMIKGLLLLAQKSEKNEQPEEGFRELKSA